MIYSFYGHDAVSAPKPWYVMLEAPNEHEAIEQMKKYLYYLGRDDLDVGVPKLIKPGPHGVIYVDVENT